MKPSAFAVIYVFAWLGSAVILGAADHPLGREEALARLQRELPVWRANLPATRPRTFFTTEQWAALPRRWAGATPEARRWFEMAMARAAEVAAEPAPAYRTPEQFVADGKASVYNSYQQLWQRPVGDRMVLLAFALAIQPESRAFRDALRSTVLTACAYPAWGMTLGGGSQTQPNSDLAAAHIARGVAIARDWHPGIWSEAETTLIRDTVRQRVATMLAGAYGGMFWGRQYQGNHNHVDVAALGLCGLAFLDEIPEAGEWLAHALNNFEQVAREASLDGSSVEGTPYWSYGASFLLQFIEGVRPVAPTAGLYEKPFLRATARYRLASSTPGFGGTLPWGDAPLRDYYGPHHILHVLAARYRDGSAQYLAANLPFTPQGPGRYSGPSENSSNDIIAWTALWHDPSVPAVAPQELDYHLPVGDLVTTRSGWSAGDYLLAIKSGFTNRNHSHLDAGALAFSFGDDWLLTTPGYGTGSSNQDFWRTEGPRWNYFSNRTESHSTLLIDGANQSFDREKARGQVIGFVSTPDWCWTEIDLTAAYAGMEQVRRQVLHRRGEYALVLDRVEDGDSHRVEWLAQVPPAATAAGSVLDVTGRTGALQINLISPAAPFRLRPADAPHMDVPPEQLRTWSVAAEGGRVEFAALLVPRPAGAPVPAIRAAMERGPGLRRTVVNGNGWTDTMLVGDRPGELQAEGCSAQALALVLRRVPGGVDSLLARGARRLQTPDFALQVAAPADLCVQRVNADVWFLQAEADGAVSLAASPGWNLVPRSGGVDLPAGVAAVLYRGEPAAMRRAVAAAPASAAGK